MKASAKKMKNRTLKILISVLISVLISCFGILSGIKLYLITAHDNSQPYIKNQIWITDSIKRAIVKDGDIEAYNILKRSYMADTSVYYPNYLLYAIIMAEDFEYIPAYYDAYTELNRIFKTFPNLGEMDERTKELAFYFLKKGSDLKDKPAMQEMNVFVSQMSNKNLFNIAMARKGRMKSNRLFKHQNRK
jgi:hypothetical protein